MDCETVILHIANCEKCRNTLVEEMLKAATSKAGSTKSEAKAEAARLNGLKGGRPRKISKITRIE